MSAPDPRRDALLHWLGEALPDPLDSLMPASEDASFRRYFRVRAGGQTHIVMDAPPPRENVRPFLQVGVIMRDAGVRTPRVHAADVERGFLLLDDFGQRCYLDVLDEASADRLYAAALDTLVRLQTRVDPARAALPPYDEALLRRELEIFHEWFLGRLLDRPLRPAETALLEAVWQVLIEASLEQPRVCVHRDFHSRNLMVTTEGVPGVLDFQDAVIGPVTYDVVSLLRDCYVAWPAERVAGWLAAYRDRLRAVGLVEAAGAECFRRWFDLTGMQRHLKAIGIFSRLQIRDGKPGYLRDIPRTFRYVVEVAADYPEFAAFHDWLQTHIRPLLTREDLT